MDEDAYAKFRCVRAPGTHDFCAELPSWDEELPACPTCGGSVDLLEVVPEPLAS